MAQEGLRIKQVFKFCESWIDHGSTRLKNDYLSTQFEVFKFDKGRKVLLYCVFLGYWFSRGKRRTHILGIPI